MVKAQAVDLKPWAAEIAKLPGFDLVAMVGVMPDRRFHVITLHELSETALSEILRRAGEDIRGLASGGRKTVPALFGSASLGQPEETDRLSKRESFREWTVKEAVAAADRIILNGSDGSGEDTNLLTALVAHEFLEKLIIALRGPVLKKDLGL